MKKYRNVKAIKAKRCTAFFEKYAGMKNVCIGIAHPCETTCDGYMCKCKFYEIRDLSRFPKHFYYE